MANLFFCFFVFLYFFARLVLLLYFIYFLLFLPPPPEQLIADHNFLSHNFPFVVVNPLEFGREETVGVCLGLFIEHSSLLDNSSNSSLSISCLALDFETAVSILFNY